MSTLQHRNVSDSHFGDNSTVNLGDVAVHYHLPHRPARAAVRVLPYPRNEDVVYRQDIVHELDRILPPRTTEHCSAALHGLGGSGCADRDCSIFWVHADSEATFVHDFQIIAKKLGLDTSLSKEDLLDAVRTCIEALEKWEDRRPCERISSITFLERRRERYFGRAAMKESQGR
ncbi:uncharacterized protein J7T54_002845 [Emericellopsis cladophorae]|uniref:Uncharacterized protein n=1 Tax=Emericellopsis cladophorae TaxID=2686198 RepID=A0A9P9XUU5_9HYPO|nr:uncharacterized protein J7T54_002845 [Emericellopsis cladophorae]KAI6777809.1 hypothetical protein J7T54_002845 [Emericellopsis cladophorae]